MCEELYQALTRWHIEFHYKDQPRNRNNGDMSVNKISNNSHNLFQSEFSHHKVPFPTLINTDSPVMFYGYFPEDFQIIFYHTSEAPLVTVISKLNRK